MMGVNAVRVSTMIDKLYDLVKHSVPDDVIEDLIESFKMEMDKQYSIREKDKADYYHGNKALTEELERNRVEIKALVEYIKMKEL